MGMDAYAIERNGSRLLKRNGPTRDELADAKQQRCFSKASADVAKAIGWVDADLQVGELCISANASAASYLVFVCGGYAIHDEYSADQVKKAAVHVRSEALAKLPGYVLADRDAILHAQVFIEACAELGLGIAISP